MQIVNNSQTSWRKTKWRGFHGWVLNLLESTVSLKRYLGKEDKHTDRLGENQKTDPLIWTLAF